MARVVEGYFTLLKILIAACLVGMVVLVFGNVFLRYAFNMGITTSEELSRFLFVWLTFLGAIVALREHGHLGVDLLVKALPALGKKVCLIASHLLMLFAVWLFLQGSWQQTLINLDVASPAAGISMGLMYGVGIVFSVSAGLILLHDLYRVIVGKVAEEELVMVKESAQTEELEGLHPELAGPIELARTAAPSNPQQR
jgi:TRAP-type C4-dicarboxylate transport system permease small subunit